jgi:hypothetical protein
MIADSGKSSSNNVNHAQFQATSLFLAQQPQANNASSVNKGKK